MKRPLCFMIRYDGYAGAVDLVEEIVSDVYRKTQDVKVREFIENNQRQSEEGSV